MQKFVIKDLGEPFDGLIVYLNGTSDLEDLQSEDRLVPICRIENDHVLFQSFSLPIEDDCLYIRSTNLVPYEGHDDDQLTGNPYGKFVAQGSFMLNKMNVTWAKYEKAVSVGVRDLLGNYLYSGNFFGDKAKGVIGFIHNRLSDDEYDPDNLVFDFKELE